MRSGRSSKSTALALLLACGCGEEIERAEAVPLKDLPPGVLDAAVRTLPEVKFHEARKAKFKGQDAYEIRGKDPRGKMREVEVSPAGNVLEVE